MPRKKVYSLVTITRAPDDSITALDVKSGLSEDEAAKMLASGSGAERRLFAGDEVMWRPSVTIGEPRKRKAKADDKPATKPKKPAAVTGTGTSFDINTGAKAPQGETHGT